MRALALIALTVPTTALSQGAPSLAGTRLDVVARGEVRRVPDIATISAGVVTQATDARAALAQNAERMARVRTALQRAGVAQRDVSTAQIALQPQYRYAENQPPVVTGYQANNVVSVRFRDIGKSGAILDALVAEGANQLTGPSFGVDRPEAALDEARVAAIGSARARADLYARATGLKIKRIVSISESGDYGAPPSPPVMLQMRAMDAAAKTDVAPGEQTLAVTVNVTFELE